MQKATAVLKAVLLDLDDTLLENPMATFLPAYFQTLTRHAAPLISPDRLISALMAGMRAMETNDGGGLTNEEAFSEVFYPAARRSEDILKPVLIDFYAKVFPGLRSLTRPAPKSRSLVERLFSAGFQVAVATNPVFPLIAIEQRLEWADVPVTDFDYALVTSMENSRALKPHPAYYREILALLGRDAGECLMVGDDWIRDIVPAAAAGISVFWICGDEIPIPDAAVPLLGHGSLSDLEDLVRPMESSHQD